MKICGSVLPQALNKTNFKSNTEQGSKRIPDKKDILLLPDDEKERNFIKGMYGSALLLMLVPLAVEQGVNIKYNHDTKQHLEQIYTNPESKDGETISLEEYQQMENIMKTKKETAERMRLRLKERSELEKYHREMLDEFSDVESENGVNISPYEQNKLDYKLSDKVDEVLPY